MIVFIHRKENYTTYDEYGNDNFERFVVEATCPSFLPIRCPYDTVKIDCNLLVYLTRHFIIIDF